MKGEYVDAKNERHHHQNHQNNMFSKLHPHSHSLHPHPHQFHPFNPNPNPNPNPFQVTSRECQTSSDNADDTATTHKRPSPNPPTDGATIEVVRRPRGRPPGSKNKPKPPVIITRDSDPPMSPYILEIPSGNDVVEAIARFCRRKNIGLCVLTGSGTVSNVTLRQPSTTPGATVTFHGRFDILSVAATFLPQSTPSMPAGFTISLAGPQGQIVGGIVAGTLLAAGTVFVVAATFNNPSYHRLPAAEEEGRAAPAGGSGEGDSPAGSGGGESAAGGEGSGGMGGMYGCHVAPSEVIWAPTARQPPPY